jgi:linoleoyl-CoA desaturase
VTMSIVFQLAHVSDLADAPAANEPLDEWAAHQLRTTVDFAPGHPLWSWMLGGLNTQVVHHLLPKTSHVHYGALQPLVARSCREFGLAYRCCPTMRAAIASHFRRLHALGQKPALD